MTRIGTIKADSFGQLLEALGKQGHDFRNMLDGGAGAGHTARKMLNYLSPKGRIFAFEPFPGNHRFFDGIDPRVTLIKKALSRESAEMGFHVPSTVTEESAWGKKGMVGYSSVGRLRPEIDPDAPTSYKVQAVTGSEELRGHDVHTIDFIKLDLQGGELAALQGLESVLPSVALMWVECTRIAGLIEFLTDHDFCLFDTEYMFMDPNRDTIENEFILTRTVEKSTGKAASFGYRIVDWPNYEESFKFHKKNSGMIQTDLVAVHKSEQEALAAFVIDRAN
jgi:FkbM family methyltransferase